MGWKPLFLTSPRPIPDQTHILGGAAVEGLYGVTNPIRIPYREAPRPSCSPGSTPTAPATGRKPTSGRPWATSPPNCWCSPSPQRPQPTPEAIAKRSSGSTIPETYSAARATASRPPTTSVSARGGELTRIEHGRWVSLERLDGPSE